MNAAQSTRLIESDRFPFEFLSSIAERESWRKEIYRPVYHLHKWWAKRLGSVFRGIILGCALPEAADLCEEFYRQHDLGELVVFDPFMGSGTTVGEAHKLGCAALGRDINPVACESVRVAFGPLDRMRLKDAYDQLAETAGAKIRRLYRANDKQGRERDVLYFFWVKTVACPGCRKSVDLFSSRIFARNAYPDRNPEVQICCPRCGDVFRSPRAGLRVGCESCGHSFNPHEGPADGTHAACPHCSKSFRILDAVKESGRPPLHRLYAKMLLVDDGEKLYLPATDDDDRRYRLAVAEMNEAVANEEIRLPDTRLEDGFNTRQAISYNYRAWRDFFNDRQTLALGWLQHAISGISDESTRDAFLLLFSGLLEFNNMFASYKGEGTGAVRHMFSHHILKPERMPIEANVWGTLKSSGSFMNLYKARLARALEYRESPFEAAVGRKGAAHSSSRPFSGRVEAEWPKSGHYTPRALYLSCGSSDDTGLADKSVDAVITDPPFFDNVHYSELADFFYAWQRLYPRGFLNGVKTTRDLREVQDADADRFASKLSSVFKECARVLKDEGTLAFTYHHSRAEGWAALASAIFDSGFCVANAHPVKSEMSVAAPKSQAKEPIQLDMIIVCRKAARHVRRAKAPSVDEAMARGQDKLNRLAAVGLHLSLNDCRVVMFSQYLAEYGVPASAETFLASLSAHESSLDESARRAHVLCAEQADSVAARQAGRQSVMPF